MSLRTYEALYIVNPELDDDAIQAVARGVDKLITDNGGEIVRSDIWGKRRLAYKVKKFSEGCYVLVRFKALPAFISKLEGYFKLSEEIIRNLVVYFDERMLRLEAEQQQQKEEEIRAGVARGAWGDRGRDRDDDMDDDDDDDPRRRRRGRGGDRGHDDDDED